MLFAANSLFHTRHVVLGKSRKLNAATSSILSFSNEGNGLFIQEVFEGVGIS